MDSENLPGSMEKMFWFSWKPKLDVVPDKVMEKILSFRIMKNIDNH